MSYAEVHGTIADVAIVVRWQDGKWTVTPETLGSYVDFRVTQEKQAGVYATATSPRLDPESPRAAIILAVRAVEHVDRLDTDIPIVVDDVPPGAIS